VGVGAEGLRGLGAMVRSAGGDRWGRRRAGDC